MRLPFHSTDLPVGEESLPAVEQTNVPGQSSSKFLHGLDAVRAWAAVSVVMLHACVPYSHPSMPGLTWATMDVPDRTATFVMWAIEIVIMPIFLIVAGILAARSMSSRGAAWTLKSRTRRLGVPLLLAVSFLMPVDLYVWLLGWLADGVIEPRRLRTLKFDDGEDIHLWGLSHLWFLQYLILYIAGLACIWNHLTRIDPHRALRYGVPACMAVGVGVLCVRPEVVWGFQHSFWPVPEKWTYSATSFFAGALLGRADPSLRWLQSFARMAFPVSTMLLVATTWLGIWMLNHSSVKAALDSTAFPISIGTGFVMALAVMTVLSATGFSLSVIGWACGGLRNLDHFTARLASASFIIYLLHHPVVAASHIGLKHLAPTLPSIVKMLISTAIAVAIPVMIHAAWGRWMLARPTLARPPEKDTENRDLVLIFPAPADSSNDRRRAG